jgi:hypothetical protein
MLRSGDASLGSHVHEQLMSHLNVVVVAAAVVVVVVAQLLPWASSCKHSFLSQTVFSKNIGFNKQPPLQKAQKQATQTMSLMALEMSMSAGI